MAASVQTDQGLSSSDAISLQPFSLLEAFELLCKRRIRLAHLAGPLLESLAQGILQPLQIGTATARRDETGATLRQAPQQGVLIPTPAPANCDPLQLSPSSADRRSCHPDATDRHRTPEHSHQTDE